MNRKIYPVDRLDYMFIEKELGNLTTIDKDMDFWVETCYVCRYRFVEHLNIFLIVIT